jgi:hypothetical protein
MGGMIVEKKICNAAYWIGIISAALALVSRGLAFIGVSTFQLSTMGEGRVGISYKTFVEGAVLFFLMAIASSAAIWTKAQKS